MSPANLFQAVTEKGSYVVGYIADGWTRELTLSARTPRELMMRVQSAIGDILSVTYIERER